jgi:hypothetical protein
MRYDDVAHLLPGLVDGSVAADAETLAFVESDLRCQAELVRYRRLLRSLATLRERRVEPPSASLHETLVALNDAHDRQFLRRIAERRKLAGAALGTAVVTAGAAAVILARSRRRAALAA